MENYNRLFLLEDPAFDMESYMSDDYRSKPQEGKANLKQIDDAWLGKSFLTENFVKHFSVAKYNTDGSYELMRGDKFFDHIQKGDQVKDELDDASSEVKEKETNEKLANAIASIGITEPVISFDLYEVREFSFTAFDGKDAYTHRVGASDDNTNFTFGIALPGDSAEIQVSENGLSVDKIEMDYNEDLGLATGLRIVDENGEGIEVEEGTIVTIFAPNYTPKEGIKLGKHLLSQIQESKGKAIEIFTEYTTEMEGVIQNTEVEKMESEKLKADKTAIVAELTSKLAKSKKGLSESDNSDDIASAKEICLTTVGDLYSVMAELEVVASDVKGYARALVALKSAVAEAQALHDTEIEQAEEAIEAANKDIKRLEDLDNAVNGGNVA